MDVHRRISQTECISLLVYILKLAVLKKAVPVKKAGAFATCGCSFWSPSDTQIFFFFMVLSERPSKCNKRMASVLNFHIRALKNADCLLGNSETGHSIVRREASELSNSTTETVEGNMP